MHRRILIIRPDRIGDVVLTTPLVRSLRQSFPDSYLAMMVHPSNRPLLENNPRIDEILTDDPTGNDKGREGFWKQVSALRQKKFDTGLMPFPRERHAWMMFLGGIRTRVGVGHKIYQMLTLTQSVSRHKYIPLRHEADYMLDLGRKIGAASDNVKPEIFLTEAGKKRAHEYLVSQGIAFQKPLIGVNPLSRGSSPNWTPERYHNLIERLLPRFNVVINLEPHDEKGRAHFADLEKRGAVILMQTLREHMASLSQLSLLISSSTGSMHIAAALNIPTVSLFCPLTACSPLLWGPLGNRSEVLLPGEGYCQTRCPGNPKICPLEDIEISQVVERAEALARQK
ncbi:MAG TPA: glycosyltransferase family 9 protein [Bacteroidota bacterium]|nr:glycosyltransferase family 9 protein [Bacteroidota bacterium]